MSLFFALVLIVAPLLAAVYDLTHEEQMTRWLTRNNKPDSPPAAPVS